MNNIETFFKKFLNNFSISFSNGKSFNFFFPISFILLIIPLIVRISNIRLDSDTAAIYGRAVETDLFSQRKALFLLCFSIILIIISCIFFKKIFKKKDKVINSILVLISIFWISILFSTILSTHKNYAFYGAFDRAEGFISLTCYLILLVYSIYTFNTTKNYKYIVVPILILVFILSFLGIFQYTGHDLINSKLGLFLVLGNTTRELSLMYETGKLYGTLYHYNYVGSFVAIVLPILSTLTIFQKKISYKIVLSTASLLSIWLLFGSTSRAGIIGIIASFIFSIIIFGRSMFKKWKSILLMLISMLFLIVVLNFSTNGIIFNKIPSLISDSISIFKDTSNFDYTNSVPIKDIKNINGHTEVVFQNETLKIFYENNDFVFKNSKNEIVNYIKNVTKTQSSSTQVATSTITSFTTTDENFKNISFKFNKVKSDTKIGYLNLKLNDKLLFIFRLGKDNTIHLISINSKDDIDVSHPETIKSLAGKEKLGSARGYIWSRSIPLIKNNLLFGSGPDTFIYQFPQDDLIGKYYTYDTPNIIVDKPHNLYLQIALNDGLIALLSFLCIILIYIISSIKLYAFNKNYSDSQILGAATCLGVIGYLFAGIFNDSVISVAPVFWIVLGVGVALNYMNRNELNNKCKKN